MSFPLLEHCLEKISNRYLLVVLAAKRSRQLNRGHPSQVETKRKKWTSVAVEEIIAGKLRPKSAPPPAAEEEEESQAGQQEAAAAPETSA